MTGPLTADHLNLLKGFPLFADLTPEDLEGVAGLSTRISVTAGTTLFEEGTKGDRFYVILDGEMEVARKEGGQTVVLAILGPGGFLSEMSLLEDRLRTASARAIRDSEVMAIEPHAFQDLLNRSPGAALTMLRTVTARLRSTEASVIEQGRLAGLGTMAAGLAHELNNPASAIQRSSSLLQTALVKLGERWAELLNLPLNPESIQAIREVEASRFLGGSRESEPFLSSRSEMEMERWLESIGSEEPWILAPTLADAGWEVESLQALARAVDADPAQRRLLVRWVAAGAEAYGLADEIRRGAEAISSIVRGVRSYTHLDRGPLHMVDVRESISNTLFLLKGRMEEGIHVVLGLPPDLPEIEAYGGELSQVWTNIIHNAVDAMEGRGTVEIRGRQVGNAVVVEIMDDGPGIPQEIRRSIFDPFFTTKPQGSGTGLGLAIAYGIVVNRHRGTLQVDSEPGRTVFRVALPTRQMSEGADEGSP